jgi:hypothetical protein
MSHIVA